MKHYAIYVNVFSLVSELICILNIPITISNMGSIDGSNHTHESSLGLSVISKSAGGS